MRPSSLDLNGQNTEAQESWSSPMRAVGLSDDFRDSLHTTFHSSDTPRPPSGTNFVPSIAPRKTDAFRSYNHATPLQTGVQCKSQVNELAHAYPPQVFSLASQQPYQDVTMDHVGFDTGFHDQLSTDPFLSLDLVEELLPSEFPIQSDEP